jgi:hypothetical protein
VESIYYDTSIGKYRGTFFHSEAMGSGLALSHLLLIDSLHGPPAEN